MIEQKPACAAPFTQLTLQPTGKVSPCCYHYGFHVGDIRRDSLAEIWNGPRMRKLRDEFLTGQIKTCRSKMRYIRCHERFSHLDASVKPQGIQDQYPLRLDVRLNGLCNLKCTMCEVWQQPNGVWDESDFWREGPEKIFPYLRELDVLGGEPFIQRDTFRLIEAVATINPGCRWTFVTNGHYPFSQRLKNALDRIQIKALQISLDSLQAEIYHRIRKTGDFGLVRETTQRFFEYRGEREKVGKGFTLILSMCVLKWNWREIPEFIAYCKSHGALCELQFAHYDPSKQASLNYLSRSEKQEVVDYLKGQVAEEDLPLLLPVLSPLEDELLHKKGGAAL